MSLGRYNPLGQMVSLREAMDRLFEDSFVTGLRGEGREISPALDIHETPDAVVVTAALPGVNPADVQITMTGQNLTIRGEFKADEEVKRDQYLYRERSYGTFSRQVQLPLRVQADRAEASFEHGLLRLTIPKAEELKPRRIEIRPGATSPQRARGGNGDRSTERDVTGKDEADSR